ncbi:ROK family protein [Amycolatopsis suaedae]|uniref:ROK family protein n=1 Tax=Amycolatopsis suaedae TaxID=2510978 RepID=A0A4Q7JA63_9PSEU|nr:ROK family protein [Amycolatopsis suaedae]RZQ64149.1 ROK family protein [Amycolatopsis suaedae]
MPITGRADPVSQRTANLAALLRALRSGPLSRTQLAARCGVNKATVSSLVTELSGRGLVRPAGMLTGVSGRPSQLVELRGESAYGLALGIEADRFSALATDLAGRVVAERTAAADVVTLGLHRGMDELAELAHDLLAGMEAPPAGVTVSVPGLVDSAGALLRFAPTLRWRDAEIADLLAARLGLPLAAIAVDNEANLGALAEAHARPGVSDLFYLSGGIGIGGGLVCGGLLQRGARGFAGEVGHVTVDPQGEHCPCGRLGCLETKAGLPAVLRAAAPAEDRLHDPALGVDGRARLLRERVRQNDQRAVAAVHELGVALGVALSTVVDVLDPDVIVLGGYLAELGDWLIEPVRLELGARTLANHARCRVEASSLGTTAGLRGAAHQAIERLFTDPTLSPLTEEAQA